MRKGQGSKIPALLAMVAILGCSPPEKESPPDPSETTRPPSVLLYLIDTLRSDRIGAYGYDEPTTPTMDELAKSGALFEQAYTPGPWTLPSVVSLMLSQPICRHRVVIDDQKIAPKTTPLAEALARSGYRTASFIANSYAGRPAGLDRGFQVYEGPVDQPAERIDLFLDQNPDKPFFIYVHDVRPHDPHRASAEYLEKFGDVDERDLKRMRNRSNEYRRLTRADHATGSPIGSTDNTREQKWALARLDRIADKYAVAYDARVREADDQLRKTLDTLRDHDALDDTAIIVVSDHGEELGDHGGWLHDHSVYEELVRSPLILRIPGTTTPGTKVETPVTLLDVAPTIAELTGAAIPPGSFEGKSLLPLLTKKEEESRGGPRVVSMRINEKKYYRPWKRSRGDQNIVVRDGPWKAVWNVEPNTIELYNLEDDPGEQSNRSDAEPQRAQRLRMFAQRYLESCSQRQEDPVPAPPLSPAAAERLRALGYLE